MPAPTAYLIRAEDLSASNANILERFVAKTLAPTSLDKKHVDLYSSSDILREMRSLPYDPAVHSTLGRQPEAGRQIVAWHEDGVPETARVAAIDASGEAVLIINDHLRSGRSIRHYTRWMYLP